jgi:hypothetical protein
MSTLRNAAVPIGGVAALLLIWLANPWFQPEDVLRTVITIATPHHGTPLASYFTTLRGQQLMQLLSLSTVYVLNFGYLPIAALLWMGSLVVRLGGVVANSALLDELFGRLLEDFTVGRRRAVRKLLRDVVHDQALMLQLTPEAMEVFNASVLPRPGIRYGASSQAARPKLLLDARMGLDPAAQVTHAIYSALYRLIVRTGAPLAASHADQTRALQHAYQEMPSGANDGIVPTLPGLGHVVHAAVATTRRARPFPTLRTILPTSTGSCRGAVSTARDSKRLADVAHSWWVARRAT